MTASFALSARPTGSAVAWCDSESIVVELPCPVGNPPYITRYPKTAEGLRRALNVILENPAPRRLPVVDHPAVKRATGAASAKLRASTTQDQRDAAAELVRRMFK